MTDQFVSRVKEIQRLLWISNADRQRMRLEAMGYLSEGDLTMRQDRLMGICLEQWRDLLRADLALALDREMDRKIFAIPLTPEQDLIRRINERLRSQRNSPKKP